ncbi:MAG TPA: ATP-dependent DNA helicase [Candidatus Dormibacteraeota bacterium]
MTAQLMATYPHVTTTALDADQLEAVNHLDGPCLVLAGPGSGKTRVIVERVLALLSRGVALEQQLVLTYTRKAADEMRTRAEAAHGPFAAEPPLTNYHSFAYGVVREWGWLVGVAPIFRIADAAERWLHAEAVLAELRPRTLWNPLRPHDLMDPLLAVIGYAKQELVTPQAYRDWAERRLQGCTDPVEQAVLQRHEEVAAVYAALDERYRRLGVFDHDDCILYAERLIREQPAARHAVADRIRYVMVDEYQDTNFAQARLVESLTTDHRNVLVVADDDQSIYKFRGASRANLDRFTREYPGHRTVVLTHNYRSTTEIVAASRKVIAGATPATRIAKQLVAERGNGAAVEIWSAPDERAEVTAVARACRELIEAGTRPADIAWLFRRHVDMQPAMHALQQCGVPYQVTGGRGYFQEREIKDLFALLAAAADPGDTQALLRCMHMPAWHVSGRCRAALATAARENDQPLSTLLADEAAVPVDDAELEAARHCLDDILELHQLTEREDVRDVFFAAIEASGFLGVIDEEQGAARLQMAANLNKFGDLLETFADWSDDRRVATALRYLHVLRDSRDADELAPIDAIEEGIVLLTTHGAKGLEWPIVFLARCATDEWSGRPRSAFDIQLPDELVPEPPPVGDGAVDEERRLFYVASTRARDRLVFTWAQRYPRTFRPQTCTPFLSAVAADDGTRSIDLEPAGDVAVRPRRTPGTPLPAHPSLAVSDLRVFRDCPRRFEYRKIWRLPVRDSVQSWYGTLIHEVLHAAAVQRTAGVRIDADAVAALWDQGWTASRGPKGGHPELRALGEDQLRRYVESPAWLDADIDAVEERVVMEMNGAEIVGRFDRLDRNNGAPPTVVDYKTSRPRDAESLKRDIQVRAYAVAMAQRAKSEDVSVELHYLQTGDVARVDFDSKFLNRAHYQLGAITTELVQAWKRGDFPARPSRWQCPRCEYRTVCDEGKEVTD